MSSVNNLVHRNLLLFLVCWVLLLSKGYGQNDSIGAYCNVFYVTSDNLEALPFADQCFVADQYSIKDPTNFKACGPVSGSASLFDKFDWVMHFYLPTPKANDRIAVAPPVDIQSKTLKMKPGTMYITITDNRSSSRYDAPLENVDFAAVLGSAKVLEYEAQTGTMPYPEYKLQMDVRFRKVDRSSGTPVLTGEPIRVKMLVMIEAKSE